jgi:hypothetical protein
MMNLMVELKKCIKSIQQILARDRRRQARKTLKQTNETFHLATKMLGSSTRSHLAGASKSVSVPALPVSDENVCGKVIIIIIIIIVRLLILLLTTILLLLGFCYLVSKSSSC